MTYFVIKLLEIKPTRKMKKRFSKILFLTTFVVSFTASAQEREPVKSNIQTYTPSKLLDKGQWDVKFFNNLYTETKSSYNGITSDKERETYFTSTLDFFTGVSDNNRLNIGLLLEYRSNVINGKSATAAFDFKNDLIHSTVINHFYTRLY